MWLAVKTEKGEVTKQTTKIHSFPPKGRPDFGIKVI